MSETVERIYPEAVNLRSMARWERKQGNVELAGVLEGAADLYERTASDLESATKSLDAHQRAVIEQHAEITKLTSQLEEARAKAIEECILLLKKERRTNICGPENATPAEMRAWDKCRYDTFKSAELAIRALLSAPRSVLDAHKEGGKS